MQFLVDGVDKVEYLVPYTLSINSIVNGRNNMSVYMVLPVTLESDIGEEVIIKDDYGNKIYAGLIASRKVKTENVPLKRYISLDICDYSRYCDRKTLAKVYDNRSQGYIVRDLITLKLSTYGVTEGIVDDGVDIEKTSYNYMKCSAILDELAAMNGKIWWIDYDKKLNFHSRSEFIAPFDLNTTHRPYTSFDVEKTDSSYRNRQYLRAGVDRTDPRTETFKGDGTRKTFNLGYPADVITAMTINGTPINFGIKEYDTGKDFYYQRNESEIIQDDAGVTLTTGQTLAVTYVGFYPILVMAQDDDEVSDRLSVEGVGDGVYEEIEDDESIDNRDLALIKATSILQYYGKIQKTVSYSTFNSGLYAGQIQNINLPDEDADGAFLITSVTAKEYESPSGFIYDVVAVDGENFGGWLEFFKRLAGTGKKFLIRENEVFVILRRTKDKFILNDTISDVTPTYAMAEVGESWYAGYCEIGL